MRVRQRPECVARVERLRLEHVHRRPCDVPRPQRIEQGVLVDQVGATGVHKPRGRTHGADFSRADDAHGRFREDEVHRDNVGPGEGFPFGHVLGLAGRRSRNREVGAPGGHAHAEGIADACHVRTGAAQPEEPQRADFDVGAEHMRSGEVDHGCAPASGADDDHAAVTARPEVDRVVLHAGRDDEPQRREALDDPPVAQHPRRHPA